MSFNFELNVFYWNETISSKAYRDQVAIRLMMSLMSLSVLTSHSYATASIFEFISTPTSPTLIAVLTFLQFQYVSGVGNFICK